jgi:hypothetical protein
MLAFREEASIRAILAAARRPLETAWRKGYRAEVGEALLSYWRKICKDLPWFEGWLLRGADAPPGITLVTAQQSERCARAWDFGNICRLIGTSSNASYVVWLSRRQIPSLEWRKWLFGGPAPAGAFVVEGELQRLRHEMSRKALVAAAGIHATAIWGWEKDDRTCGPIKAILNGDQPDKTQWEQLFPSERERMLKIAAARKLAACCQRAKLSLAQYYKLRAEAVLCGVKELLDQYMITGPTMSVHARKAGLVAANFFIPTTAMLRFRAEANRIWAEQSAWSIQHIPGFWDWFADWTTPKGYHGGRHAKVASRDGHMDREGPTQADGQDAKNGSPATPRRGGRQRDPATEALYEWVYNQREAGKKYVVIIADAREKFEVELSNHAINSYAKRHAKRTGKPFSARG